MSAYACRYCAERFVVPSLTDWHERYRCPERPKETPSE